MNSAGRVSYKAQWDATDAAGGPVGTGVYIYRLTTGNWQEARKLVLIDGPAGSPGGSGGNIEGGGARYGVEISGGEIIPATFTWSPDMGSLVAEVTSVNNVIPLDLEDSGMASNPFYGTSLPSVIQVVSAF